MFYSNLSCFILLYLVLILFCLILLYSSVVFSRLSHGDGDVVADGAVNSVQPEAAQQQQFLEGSEVEVVPPREPRLLRVVQVVPLRYKRRTDTFSV